MYLRRRQFFFPLELFFKIQSCGQSPKGKTVRNFSVCQQSNSLLCCWKLPWLINNSKVREEKEDCKTSLGNCVRGTRTQPLIYVGCSVAMRDIPGWLKKFLPLFNHSWVNPWLQLSCSVFPHDISSFFKFWLLFFCSCDQGKGQVTSFFC